MQWTTGGVCAPKGFAAAGIHVGFRQNPQKEDLALIYSKTPCVAAGVTTQNLTCAAPVMVTRRHLKHASAHAIVCNSGNANACTENSLEVAEEMCCLVAQELEIDKTEVLVGSTGVIGVPMCLDPMKKNTAYLVENLSLTGSDAAARAIMTTDTKKKEAALSLSIGEHTVTVGGISKGSGMIHPNMATMLGFITTDVAIAPKLLQQAVSQAADNTFNMVSVDGDTSTNDMVLVLANGLANNPEITKEGKAYDIFYKGLEKVFRHLAIAIASDGEGASKLITCQVAGGETLLGTKTLAKAVITSNLVKAAMFGADANWGRVLCALGYSGVPLEVSNISIKFLADEDSVTVCDKGQSCKFSEKKAYEILSSDQITIYVTVGDGPYSATAWGCDLTYDYVKINGEYRS